MERVGQRTNARDRVQYVDDGRVRGEEGERMEVMQGASFDGDAKERSAWNGWLDTEAPERWHAERRW